MANSLGKAKSALNRDSIIDFHAIVSLDQLWVPHSAAASAFNLLLYSVLKRIASQLAG